MPKLADCLRKVRLTKETMERGVIQCFILPFEESIRGAATGENVLKLRVDDGRQGTQEKAHPPL